MAVADNAPDLSTVGVDLPCGRVLVCMVLDDLGDGVEASTANVSGSAVASRVRAAYTAAKGRR